MGRSQKRGGLELHGRDEGLEEDLEKSAGFLARSLEEALRRTTTDELVRAFFDLIQPFVMMFRAILDFFEKASQAKCVTNGTSWWTTLMSALITFVASWKNGTGYQPSSKCLPSISGGYGRLRAFPTQFLKRAKCAMAWVL